MVITEDDVSLYFSNPRIFIMAEKYIFGITKNAKILAPHYPPKMMG